MEQDESWFISYISQKEPHSIGLSWYLCPYYLYGITPGPSRYTEQPPKCSSNNSEWINNG